MLALAAAISVASLACGRSAPPKGLDSPALIGRGDSADLTGAGATFPAPLYQAWFQDYNKLVPGVKTNYQAVGSGGGIQQFTAKTVDFGATDLAMSDAEMAKAPGAQHLPMALGSVVITYNVFEATEPLKFDGDTIAKIWLGTIRRWNDPALVALNPGVKLPAAEIAVVSRSDSSGTTGVFTDYLSTISPEWKSRIGVQKAVKWPVGQGGTGNAGVTNGVKQTRNAIGYVELNYAFLNKLPIAQVRNRAGAFVTPSVESTSAAAASATLPPDYRVSIVNAAGEGAYPIASFTYLLVHQDAPSCAKATPLVRMLWWIFHDPSAAQTAKDLQYGPVPQQTLASIERTLSALKCEGKAILNDS